MCQEMKHREMQFYQFNNARLKQFEGQLLLLALALANLHNS